MEKNRPGSDPKKNRDQLKHKKHIQTQTDKSIDPCFFVFSIQLYLIGICAQIGPDPQPYYLSDPWAILYTSALSKDNTVLSLALRDGKTKVLDFVSS